MNLFQVPTPTIGLMGRQGPRPRLMPSEDGQERMLAALAAQMMQPQQEAAPVAPQRERVSAMSVLGRVLAPNTFAALDSERSRLQAEAQRPQREAMLQSALSGISDPRERALFMGLGGEDWQKNVGQQYAPQVVSPGAVQAIGGRAVVGAPQQYDFGDTRRSYDPVSRVDSLVATRGPTIAEQTAQVVAETGRINATNPVNVAPGGQLRNPITGALVAEGAPRILAAADATDLVDDRGNPIYRNVRDAPVANPADAAKAAERRGAALDRIRNTRAAVNTALEQTSILSTGTLSGLIPLNQSRANLEATADTIASNLSFTELQKMREASPTGGALGGIAVRELDLLGATVASLKQSQSPEQFRRSLQTINESLNRWEQAVNASAAQSGGGAGAGQPVTVNTPAEAQALPPGTIYRNPQGQVFRR